ncbi:MAG: GNAT family N-acetyltransferase [Alphaproteobacteria bacterium]|nr:GNAT family N-acetyltransferase [Alphaproteobacteria bacterium]
MPIEPLTLKDCKKAAQLHQSAFFKGWGESDFQEFLQNPLICGLKIEKNDELSGYILWREIGEEAEILTLVVASSFQRQGVGTYLLTTLCEYLVQKRITKLFLEVAEDNIHGKTFYIKNGFVFLNIRPQYYPRKENKFISAYTFLKELYKNEF